MTSPQPAGKITAALLGEAVIALEATAAALGISKTDTVNRGIQVYAYLAAVQRQGGEIWISQFPGDRLHRVSLDSPEKAP